MKHLVFLSGASGNTAYWDPLIAQLPAEYTKQVIAYPEFDHAPAHPDVYDFASLGNYVLAQIEQECIIIAQSMGGIFAVQAALKKSKLVQGLVLIATSGGIDLSSFNVQDWRSAYQASFLNHPNWFVTAQADYLVQLSEIQAPVLLLWGDSDPISPVEVGQYLKQQFKNASLHIIHGGDHLFAEQYVSETAQLVCEYLKHLAARSLEELNVI